MTEILNSIFQNPSQDRLKYEKIQSQVLKSTFKS